MQIPSPFFNSSHDFCFIIVIICRKHLAQRVQEAFGLASEEKAKELMPMKGSCVCMKVVLNSGDCVNVYVVENTPVLVETESGLLPTVCALWKVPELVPVLDIHSVVLRKVSDT